MSGRCPVPGRRTGPWERPCDGSRAMLRQGKPKGGAMPDPFQNVSAAGPEFIEVFARQLEVRAAEPAMVAIVEAYLDDLALGRRSASRSRSAAAPARPLDAWRRVQSRTRVLGIEPSPELLTHARRLAEGIDNLTFETGDGAALPLDDGTVDAIVFHTVLCHVVSSGRAPRGGDARAEAGRNAGRLRCRFLEGIAGRLRLRSAPGLCRLLRRELRDGPLPRRQAPDPGEETPASTSSTSGSPAGL